MSNKTTVTVHSDTARALKEAAKSYEANTAMTAKTKHYGKLVKELAREIEEGSKS